MTHAKNKVTSVCVGSFVGTDKESYIIYLILSGGKNFFNVGGETSSIEVAAFMQQYCEGVTLEEGLQSWLDSTLWELV